MLGSWGEEGQMPSSSSGVAGLGGGGAAAYVPLKNPHRRQVSDGSVFGRGAGAGNRDLGVKTEVQLKPWNVIK